MSERDAFRLIQMSDLHLSADAGKSLLGVNTRDGFIAVMNLLKQCRDPIDLILLTGDLSHDGSKISYEIVADQFREIPVPVYVVPGNHDLPVMMNQVYPRDTITGDRQFFFNNWQIILLNSHVPNAVHGELDASQLQYLEECLQEYPDYHAMIVFHHHPVLMQSAWLDGSRLMNAPAFWQVVSRYPRVKQVLFGHVHQAHDEVVQGVRCLSAPSTCIQFKPQHDEFKLDKIPQGFRKILMYSDGRVETEVCRLSNYVGVFDEKAKGY